LGQSVENIVFDPTYYLLVAVLAIVLVYTAVLGLTRRKGFGARTDRDRAVGTTFVAAGAAASNIGAASLTAVFRDSLIGGVPYLQAQFLIVYVGFGAVLYGMQAILFSARAPNGNLRRPRSNAGLRVLFSSAYVLAVGISAVYLLNPATYTISFSGTTQHVARQTVFWLPVFLTLSFGIIALLSTALKSEEVNVRRHAFWFVLFATLVLLGLLREATVIPSSGDPLTDLLLAFIPLTFGGLILYVSSRKLGLSSPRV
jgi:hypothetical protein